MQAMQQQVIQEVRLLTNQPGSSFAGWSLCRKM